MANTPYQPPEQSKLGQVLDALFVLVVVVASLFAPIYLGLAGGGKIVLEFAEKTWAGMGQSPSMQAQWEQLGFTPETAADIIASRFNYSFSLVELIVTAIVVVGYFYFVVRFSDVEYKDVINERFGPRSGGSK